MLLLSTITLMTRLGEETPFTSPQRGPRLCLLTWKVINRFIVVANSLRAEIGSKSDVFPTAVCFHRKEINSIKVGERRFPS